MGEGFAFGLRAILERCPCTCPLTKESDNLLRRMFSELLLYRAVYILYGIEWVEVVEGEGVQARKSQE